MYKFLSSLGLALLAGGLLVYPRPVLCALAVVFIFTCLYLNEQAEDEKDNEDSKKE